MHELAPQMNWGTDRFSNLGGARGPNESDDSEQRKAHVGKMVWNYWTSYCLNDFDLGCTSKEQRCWVVFIMPTLYLSDSHRSSAYSPQLLVPNQRSKRQ